MRKGGQKNWMGGASKKQVKERRAATGTQNRPAKPKKGKK